MSENERQIEPLSSQVLANLTVEELEQRQELQLLQTPEGNDCVVNYSCGSNNSSPCPSDCPSNATCIADSPA